MFEISKIAKTLVSQSSLFNCSLEETWSKWMHPAITENVKFDEVIEYINKKIKLGENYKEF